MMHATRSQVSAEVRSYGCSGGVPLIEGSVDGGTGTKSAIPSASCKSNHL